MGLVKDALKAIIQIDRNLAYISKMFEPIMIADIEKLHQNDKNYRAEYLAKPIETSAPSFVRVMTGKDFCYPDHLTFGGRLRAIRMFAGFTQSDFADDIGVTAPHISNLEADKSHPSSMLIHAVSRRFKIDEHWLTTGELPQASESPSIAMGKVNPLSGFDGKLSIKASMDRVRQARLEVQNELKAQEDSR